MGRAQQRVRGVALAGRRDRFTGLFGSGRGLRPEVSLERDLAGIDVDTLLGSDDSEAAAAAFFLYRRHGGSPPDRIRLHEYLTEHLASDLWYRWTDRGLGTGLRMLGLGTRSRSPWLLSQEHKPPISSGHIRTVHIADLSPEREFVGDEASAAQLVHLHSLCGLDATQLNTRMNAARGNRHLFRGSWRRPSAINAVRCWRCQQLAVGLAIPALSERGRSRILGDSTASGRALSELRTVAADALEREPSWTQVQNSVSSAARNIILERLTALACEDPLPIVLATLTVDERRPLTRFAQPDRHTLLAALPWRSLLDRALPATFDGAGRSAELHDALLVAVRDLRY